MNLTNIKNAITSKAAMSVLKVQKNSPHILFGIGVIGVVGTAVAASRATMKVEGILDSLDKNKALIDRAGWVDPSYPQNYKNSDLTIAYSRAILKLAQAYAPAVIIGGVTIACFTGSHRILNARNAAITAAYGVLQQGFDEYRQRVVKELGADKDREFRYGAIEKEVMVETETGPQVKKIKTVDPEGGASIYAKFFDKYNPNFVGAKPELNLMFLRSVERYMNDLLNAKGYVLLNDVYDALGMDRTPEGCVVGWLSSKQGGSDGYVDFGICDRDDRFYDFMVGNENALLLDFNVDGIMYDKI